MCEQFVVGGCGFGFLSVFFFFPAILKFSVCFDCL